MDLALPVLPPGLLARPLTGADADGVYAVIAACELAHLGEVAIEPEDIESDWQRPAFDLATDSVGVEADGRLVAVAEVFRGHRADVQVHPDHEGRGIGTALMTWTWERARRYGSPRVGQTVPDRNTAAAALFTAHGYEAAYHSWVLTLPPETRLGEPVLPPGVRLRAFEPGRDERAAYQVIEDAFNEWPGRQPSTYDDWAPGVVGRGGFEPWQLVLAVRETASARDGSTEEVVGACQLIMADRDGWVNQVAVRRDHRGQGLGRALLASAFATAREHGATRFELSTDSRTGALGVYEKVGMQVRLKFRHWAKYV